MAESGLRHSRSTPQTWTCLWGPRPESESTFGCRGFKSTLSPPTVHVRQIRLAAAVRKTAALRGFGGSNPLTCTRLVVSFKNLGGGAVYLAALKRQRSHVRIVPQNGYVV